MSPQCCQQPGLETLPLTRKSKNLKKNTSGISGQYSSYSSLPSRPRAWFDPGWGTKALQAIGCGQRKKNLSTSGTWRELPSHDLLKAWLEGSSVSRGTACAIHSPSASPAQGCSPNRQRVALFLLGQPDCTPISQVLFSKVL